MAVLGGKRRMPAPSQNSRKKKSAAFCCREEDDWRGFLYLRHSRLVSLKPYLAWQSRFVPYVNTPFVVASLSVSFLLNNVFKRLEILDCCYKKQHACATSRLHTNALTQLRKLQRIVLYLNDNKETHKLRALRAGYLKAAQAPVEPGCCHRPGPRLTRAMEELCCPRCLT